MADIEITCPACGKGVTVSEFANPDAIACHACGEKLSMPARAPTQTRRGLQVAAKPEPEPEPEPDTEESETHEWRFTTQTRKRPEQKKKVWVGPATLAWLIFSILACGMYFVRFHGVVPALTQNHFDIAGPIIYLAFHATITLKAFKDSVFNGILCFLLPPYALYYLFFVCDDFYLRAVFGGVLVGIGLDAYLFFQTAVLHFFDEAHRFIQGGALR